MCSNIARPYHYANITKPDIQRLYNRCPHGIFSSSTSSSTGSSTSAAPTAGLDDMFNSSTQPLTSCVTPVVVMAMCPTACKKTNVKQQALLAVTMFWDISDCHSIMQRHSIQSGNNCERTARFSLSMIPLQPSQSLILSSLSLTLLFSFYKFGIYSSTGDWNQPLAIYIRLLTSTLAY